MATLSNMHVKFQGLLGFLLAEMKANLNLATAWELFKILSRKGAMLT